MSSDLHVRWTTRSNGPLVIRPGDPDGVYVLVTGQCPTFTVMGWIHSYDAKQPCYWRSPNGCNWGVVRPAEKAHSFHSCSFLGRA
jgi:hypothetical protein